MGVFGEYTGNTNIPAEKKELFVQQMIKLLNYGGMMSFEQVNMYGHKISLLTPLEMISDDGISFHYNYFEDDAWEPAGFDANTCKLWSNKIGSQEFSAVIMAGYCLSEQYDKYPGLACINGDYIHSSEYIGWINHLLGTKFSMIKRFSLWENAEHIVQTRMDAGYNGVFSYRELLRLVPRELKCASGGTDLADLLYITKGTKTLDTAHDINEGTYPADVLKCKKVIRSYLDDATENTIENLWEFLRKDYNARKNITDGALKQISELSSDRHVCRKLPYPALKNAYTPIP